MYIYFLFLFIDISIYLLIYWTKGFPGLPGQMTARAPDTRPCMGGFGTFIYIYIYLYLYIDIYKYIYINIYI